MMTPTKHEKMQHTKILIFLCCLFALCACSETPKQTIKEATANNTNTKEKTEEHTQNLNGIYLKVLGVAQDAGYPQAACRKQCCQDYWNGKRTKKHVVSLGVVNTATQNTFLFEATPDIWAQMQSLSELTPQKNDLAPNGIFLTHAHIGHYTGLIHLGREVMGAKGIPVYAMPKMRTFLTENGPWSQLVALRNIQLQKLKNRTTVTLDKKIEITPFLVPHRDEFSETVGYTIAGPNKKVLFIPDIDKWQKWEYNIIDEIAKVDYAFVDGTFFENAELPNRDMSEIPHPFIEESMEYFRDLSATEKAKIHFIHFNHTNPVMNELDSKQQEVIDAGFRVAVEGQVLGL